MRSHFDRVTAPATRPWQYRPDRSRCVGTSAVNSEAPSCRRKPELSSNCTNDVFRSSVRDAQSNAGAPSRVRPRSPMFDHNPHVRGVSHDTREPTECAARSSRRDTSTGNGITRAHRKSLVKATASDSTSPR